MRVAQDGKRMSYRATLQPAQPDQAGERHRHYSQRTSPPPAPGPSPEDRSASPGRASEV